MGGFIELGIIDSTYNLLSCLNDAYSIGKILLNSSTCIALGVDKSTSDLSNYKHLAVMWIKLKIIMSNENYNFERGPRLRQGNPNESIQYIRSPLSKPILISEF